jgi:hypothetical protein
VEFFRLFHWGEDHLTGEPGTLNGHMMDTHYHLLLETPCGNRFQIMRHINGADKTYFKEIGLHFGIGESGVSQAAGVWPKR